MISASIGVLLGIIIMSETICKKTAEKLQEKFDRYDLVIKRRRRK